MKYDIYAGRNKVFVAGEPVDVICFEGKYYVISGRPSGLFGRYRVLHLDHLMHYYEFHTIGWCDAFRAYFWQLREKTLQFLDMELSSSISDLLKSRISIGNFHGDFENHGRFFTRVIADLVPEMSDEVAKSVVWSMDTDATGLFYPACNVRSEANTSILLPPRFANLEAHMGVLDQPSSAGDVKSITRQQQFVFADDKEGHSVIIPSAVDEVRSAKDETFAKFANYFERPLKLNSYNWPVGGNLFADINPWDDYLEHPVIVNRINNYKMFRGTLCFKIVCSGTPFHFGRAIAAYQPYHRYDDVNNYAALDRDTLVRITNLPKFFIDPSDSSAGYMEIPFFYHRDTLNITVREWINMGNILLRTINPLKHANNGTDPVTVTTFVWMKNVELSGLTSIDTSALQPQMGEIDEANKEGVISGPATKVAGMASAMGKVPYIGPYANATAALATGTAAMAKVFGMSRPPLTKTPEPLKPKPFSSMALTTVPDGSERLSVDDKQEMSIDPRISGSSSDVDPLSIQNIVSHESWFQTFTWPRSSAPENFLFNCRVTPMIWRSQGTTNYLTATAFAALPFNSWSGSLEFRFQVVCSKMHNGKLRINYDPNYASAGEATHSQYLTSYSKIIDLRHTSDCTISIPMAQPQTYKEMLVPGLDAATEVHSTTRFTNDPQFSHNGTLSVVVQNDLTTPNDIADNDVEVNVFVKGGPDLTFRDPSNRLGYFAVEPFGFGAQSGELQAQLGEIHTEGDLKEDNAPTQDACVDMTAGRLPTRVGDVYYGETIDSFRPLIKRFNHHERMSNNTTSALEWEAYFRRTIFPRLKGPMPNAVTPAVGGNWNFVNFTLLNYITLGFAGSRGSIRWKFVPTVHYMQQSKLSIEQRNVRFGITDLVVDDVATATQALTTPELARLAMLKDGDPIDAYTGLAGGAVTQSSVNHTLEVDFPYYSVWRFEPGYRTNYEVRDLDYDRGYPNTRVYHLTMSSGRHPLGVGASTSEYIDTYVAAGEDYTVYFFTGAPPLRYWATPPALL